MSEVRVSAAVPADVLAAERATFEAEVVAAEAES
jgi:hypothetical protein